LHDAIQIIENGIFVLIFFTKEQKPVSFQKNKKKNDLENGRVVFNKNFFFSTLITVSILFCDFPLIA